MRQLMLAIILGVICFGTPIAAHATATCSSLRNVALVDLPNAPTNIISGVDVPTTVGQPPKYYVPSEFSATPIGGGVMRSTDLPAYCEVTGIVAPQVKFQLRMPANWNGKFLMQGCGGMCGVINMEATEDAMIQGYAVVNTDMGHEGDAGATLWAMNNVEARVDFGWRATHVVALAAKALIAEYYGSPPKYSYFRGYSTGGNQAVMEAQRFPEDFNGILATAPAYADALPLFWSARASVDDQGHSLISPAKVKMVHAAVMKACGGEKDGYLADPRTCDWKPESISCNGAAGPNCLTDAEIGVVDKIYDGARDSSGFHVTLGMPRGSELEWLPLYVFDPDIKGWPQDGNLPFWDSPLVTMLARDLEYFYDPGPTFSVQHMDFFKYVQTEKLTDPFRFARNPDLREFEAHGGKLILLQGWNDPEVPAFYSLDYYRTVVATMGGLDATQKFFRLFFLPGVAHVRGGQGADAVDELPALADWVEHGKAPTELATYHLKIPQNYMGIPAVRYPLEPSSYDYVRPVYPFPLIPAYNGTGDYADPKNWHAVPGAP
jgi:hypothetical protein